MLLYWLVVDQAGRYRIEELIGKWYFRQSYPVFPGFSRIISREAEGPEGLDNI